MNKLRLGLYYMRDGILNMTSRSRVVLISEPAVWSIYEDCKNIQKHLRDSLPIRIAFTPFGLRNKIVHFASAGTYIKERGLRSVDSSNKIILTWFHIAEHEVNRLKQLPAINRRAAFVHTSCSLTAKELVAHGLEDNKLVIIPIGVDTTIFRPGSEEEKNAVRDSLGIPRNAMVIGSFQKDGNGWGAGDEPKLIKGPDIFCDAVEAVAKQHPIHVLLSGPARGYVKNRLRDAGIPHTHVITATADGTAPYYRALDLYVIASRAEGGPKAVFEASASGIPVVSSAVGMVPDTMEDAVDCYIVPVGRADELAEKISKLIVDPDTRSRIAQQAILKAQQYAITKTVREYYEKMYRKLA